MVKYMAKCILKYVVKCIHKGILKCMLKCMLKCVLKNLLKCTLQYVLKCIPKIHTKMHVKINLDCIVHRYCSPGARIPARTRLAISGIGPALTATLRATGQPAAKARIEPGPPDPLSGALPLRHRAASSISQNRTRAEPGPPDPWSGALPLRHRAASSMSQNRIRVQQMPAAAALPRIRTRELP